MTGIKRSPRDFSIERLDNELIARGARIAKERRFNFKDLKGTPARDEIMAQTEELYRSEPAPPLDDALSHISIQQLAHTLILKIKEAEDHRAMRGKGMRLDMYEITHSRIKRNARATASIWMKKDVEENPNQSFSLRHKYYGESFNLDYSEPYYNQPIASGRLCTGFLVQPDVIASAGHCADECNVKNLCFVFGYEMKEAGYPATQASGQDVYNGVEVIKRVYDPRGSGADWALVRLDRPVSDREPVTLAKADIQPGEKVYVLGHPCGLPLKFVPAEPVTAEEPGPRQERAFFSAELTIYGGNSGSPVFNERSHELVGIVVRGDQQDFRWTGRGWMSIRYPNPNIKSNAPQCTRVSEFRAYCGEGS